MNCLRLEKDRSIKDNVIKNRRDVLNPSKAGLSEGSFFWGGGREGGVNLTPLHISRITYLISI